MKALNRLAYKVFASAAAASLVWQSSPARAQTAPSMDMTSTTRTMTAPTVGSGSVVIVSGGTPHAVKAGTLLTPAEAAAVSQVLNSGRQQLTVGSQGNATAGTFNIGQSSISSLVIPQGVTSTTRLANLNIVGNLSNYGIFNIERAITNIAGTSLQAANIYNHIGALINSAVPLNIGALGQIVNQGAITSSSDLGLAANSITNNGLISAASNINISSLTPDNIVFNNIGGQLVAGGNVNVRDANFAGKYNFSLAGGDVLARNLNIWSGGGNIDVVANEVSAVVNAAAANIHILANSDTLHIGNIVFSDDPTFFNYGNISIDGAITSASNNVAPGVAIVATQDITSTSGGSINTQAGGTTGFPVIVVAGVNFTTLPLGASGQSNVSGNLGGDTSTTLTLTGGSATGGKIDLTSLSQFSTTGGPGFNGGNVTLAAFPGTGSGSGTIATGNITTDGGNFTATNGNVTIIGGAASDPTGGSAITTGSITTDTTGALQGGILIVTGTPVLTDGPFSINNGQVTGGNANASLGTNSVNPGASIETGTLITNTAPITLVAGSNVTLNGSLSTNGVPTSGLLGPGGNILVFAGGNVSGSATNIITSGGATTNNPGGQLILAAGVNSTVSVQHTFPSSPLEDVVTAAINITGPSATGGSINLSSLSAINTTAGTSGPNGGSNGGDIDIIAFSGATASSGTISTPSVSIGSGGSPITGSSPQATTNNVNGNVRILAGGTSGTTINVGSIDTTGGNEGGGSITIVTANPSVGLPFSYSYTSTAVTNPVTITGAISQPGALVAGNATVGNLNASGGPNPTSTSTTAMTDIAVRAGGNLTIGSVTNVNYSVTPAGGVPSFNSSSILLEAGQQMTLNGPISLNAGAAQTSFVGNLNGTTSVAVDNTTGLTAGTNVSDTTGGTQISAGTAISSIDANIGFPGSTTNTSTIVLVSPSVQAQLSLDPSFVGSTIGGAGIPAGTTVSYVAGPVPFNGNLSSNSNAVVVQSIPAGIVVGSPLNGIGLPAGTTLAAIDAQPLVFSGSVTGGSNTVNVADTTNLVGQVGFTGDTNGTANVTNVSTAGLLVGMTVTGGGLPAGTTILSINPSASSIQLSNSAAPNTGVSFTQLGSTITGTNIPAGTTIQTVTPNTSITISNPVSGSGGPTSISITQIGQVGLSNLATTTFTSAPLLQLPNIGLSQPATATGSNVPLNVAGSVTLTQTAIATANGASLINYNIPGGAGGSVVMRAGSYNLPAAVSVSANGNGGRVPALVVPYLFTGTVNDSSPVINIGSVAILTPITTGAVIVTVSPPAGVSIPVGTTVLSTQPTPCCALTMTNNGTTPGGAVSSGLAVLNPTDPVGGDGGSISITSTSTTSPVTIGGTGGFALSATSDSTGGNGGSVAVTSGQNISVTTPATSLNVSPSLGTPAQGTSSTVGSQLVTGAGGNIALTAAKGTVFVSGALSANGAASTLPSIATGGTGNLGGNGGIISIIVNSTSAFNVGGATAGGNGTTAAISAAGNAVTGTGNIASFGSGGSISIVNLGSGGITVGSGMLSVAAAGAVDESSGNYPIVFAGSGGNINLEARAASATVFSAGSLNVDGGSSSTTLNGGDGGTITIVCNTPSGTPFVVDPSATNNGVQGTISASGAVGGIPTSANTALLFTPSGNGGSISLLNLGAGGIGIGAAASTLSVAAAAADNNLSGGANLPGHNRAGQGGSIFLSAPKGPVLSLSSLDASGGAANTTAGAIQDDSGMGGSITIIGNSSTAAFKVGTPTGSSNDGPTSTTFGVGNGIAGTLTANGYSGGKISITALGTKGIRIGQVSGNIAINASTNLVANPNPPAGAGGFGGQIELNAPKGPVLITSSLSVNGSDGASNPGFISGGNGGTIAITTNSTDNFSIGGTSTTTGVNGIIGSLQANGGGGQTSGGNGGSISIVNLGTGGINILAAGTLSVTSVAAALGSTAGDGGHISLQAPKGKVIIAGGLSAEAGAAFNGTVDPYSTAGLLVQPPAANGPSNIPSAAQTDFAGGLGGSIYILCNSTTQFQVGGTTGTVNGSAGALSAGGWSGGNITIINTGAGGIEVTTGNLTVTAGGALPQAYFGNIDQRYTGGPGGTISLQAPKGPVFINGGLNVDGGQDGITSQNNYFRAGPGGQISILTSSSQPFIIGSTAATNGSTAVLSASGFDGGTISINNNGSGGISVDPSMINIAPAQGADTVGASSYLFTNALPPPATYSINFPGNGDGGNGGRIYLNALGSGGKVFVDQTSGVSLTANGGSASSTNPTPGIPGNGGTISIVTNSTKAFNLGGATSPAPAGAIQNGTAGTLSVNGYNAGTLSVKNLGTGGITFIPMSVQVSAAAAQFATLSDPAGGNGGNISLEAPNGTLQASVAGTLSADAQTNAQASSIGGTIVLTGKVINTGTTAQSLLLSAMGDSQAGDFGVGGSIFVSQSSSTAANVLNIGNGSPLTFNVSASMTDGSISISSGAGISINGKVATGTNVGTGRITLSAGGSSNISTNGGVVVTSDLILKTVSGNVGAQGGPLSTAIQSGFLDKSLTFVSQSGSLFISNAPANVGDLNLGELSTNSATDTISVTTNGALFVNGVISTPGALSLKSESTVSCPTCSITLNETISAGTAKLSADGSGAGGGILGGLLVSAKTLTLNANVDGINLTTAAATLTINVQGLVGGSTSVSLFNQGNMTLQMGTVTNVSDLNVVATGSIATAGDITQFTNVTLDNSGQGNQSITIGGLLGNGSATGSVTLNASGSIVQTSAANVIQANVINLTSQNGNIGVPTRTLTSNVYTPQGTPIQINLGTSGTLTINGSVPTSVPGTVYINNNGSAMEIAGAAGGSDLVVTNNGDITVSGSMSTAYGSIYIQNASTTAGIITVNGNVAATGGPLVILNSNQDGSAGRIAVSDDVTLAGSAWTIDNNLVNSSAGVALLVGAGPFFPPVTGSTPSPNPPAISGSGTVFYGPNSITVNASPVNINVTGANVVFSSDSLDAITLAGATGNVNINAPSMVQTLSGLTTAALSAAAALPGSGVTQSGSTFTIAGSVNLSNLSSVNLPATTTVQFNNFSQSNPVAVNVLSGANTKVAADFNFTSDSSNSAAVLSVNSVVSGTVLSIPSGGSLTSDGSSLINVGGNFKLGGAVTAGTNLTINTGAAVASAAPRSTVPFAGTMTLTGKMSAGSTTIPGTITLSSSGSILQTAGSLSASSMFTALGGLNSGYSPSLLTLNFATVSTMTIFGIGNGSTIDLTGNGINIDAFQMIVGNSPITISQSGPFSMAGAALGSVQATSKGNITTNNFLCGTCSFKSSGFTYLNDLQITAPQGTLSIASSSTAPFSLTGFDGVTSGYISARNGVIVTTGGPLNVLGGSIDTTSGSIQINARKQILMDDVTVSAGRASFLSGGVVAPADVTSRGNISLNSTSGGITTVGSFTTVAGDISLISKNGNIFAIGLYEADGGNVTLATGKGAIFAETAIITANALGTTPASCTGGLINISSGVIPLTLVGTTLSRTITDAPGSLPGQPIFLQPDGSIGVMGSNVVITNIFGAGPTGTVVQSVGGGSINLGIQNPTYLNLTGGAMLFTTKGTGSQILFEGTTLTTNSLTPIAFVESGAPKLELDGATHSRVIVNAQSDTVVRSTFGNVHFKKGAVALVSINHEGLRVLACSGPGHVAVVLNSGEAIDVGPAEEVLISDRAVGESEQMQADGFGRRDFRNGKLSKCFFSTCEVSLITVLSYAPEFAHLKQARNAEEKRLFAKLLRTAAALSTLRSGHAAFRAMAKEALPQARAHDLPVSYVR